MAGIKDFRKKALLFLVKFFLVYAVLQFLILAIPLDSLENFVAATEAGLLGLKAADNMVLFDSYKFEVVANCTGLMSVSVLAAIIFSLRKPGTKKKIALLALGALVLLPLNILRVYLVLLAAVSFNPEAAAGLHIATWFATSAAILLLWYYLTKKLAGVEKFADLL